MASYRRSIMLAAVFAIGVVGVNSSADAAGHSFVVRFEKTQIPSTNVWIGTGRIGGTDVNVRATLLGAVRIPPDKIGVTDFVFEIFDLQGNVLQTAMLTGVVSTKTGQIALSGHVPSSAGSSVSLIARTRDGLVNVSGTALLKL